MLLPPPAAAAEEEGAPGQEFEGGTCTSAVPATGPTQRVPAAASRTSFFPFSFLLKMRPNEDLNPDFFLGALWRESWLLLVELSGLGVLCALSRDLGEDGRHEERPEVYRNH